MNLNANGSDEEVYSSFSLDLSALEKLDEITQRLTMDALNASDTAVNRPIDVMSFEHSEPTSSTRKQRNSLNSSIIATDEEMKYRMKLFPEPSKVLKATVRCTACGTSLLKHVVKARGLYFHPLLQVLVCQDCREFYGDGEFPLDDDHSDTYCRWCAQGGSLYCCSACSYVFCKTCVRRNFKHSMLDEIEEEDWKCFVCNPDALWKHRALCWAAREYVSSISSKEKELDSSEASDEEQRRRRRRARERRRNPKGRERTKSPLREHLIGACAPLKVSEEESQNVNYDVGKRKLRKKCEKQSGEKETADISNEKHKNMKVKNVMNKEGEINITPELTANLTLKQKHYRRRNDECIEEEASIDDNKKKDSKGKDKEQSDDESTASNTLRNKNFRRKKKGKSDEEETSKDESNKYKKLRKKQGDQDKKEAEVEGAYRNKESRKKKKEQTEEEEITISDSPMHKQSSKKRDKRNGKETTDKSKGDESFTKSKEECAIVRDTQGSGDGEQMSENGEDEEAKQILAMRKTCMLMEKLTKDTHSIAHSVTRKTNQLHVWISAKNRISHKQFPTTSVKLSKMIMSFKKILLNLHIQTEELQNKVVEAEKMWTNNLEGGEKKNKNQEEGDMKIVGNEEENKINGNEVGLENGKGEEIRKEQVDRENGTPEEEEIQGGKGINRVNGCEGELCSTAEDDGNDTLDTEDMNLNESMLIEKKVGKDEVLESVNRKKIVEVKGIVGSGEEEAKGKNRNPDDNDATDNEELDLNGSLLVEKGIEDEELENVEGKKVVEGKGTVGSEEEEAKGKTSRNSDDNNASDNEDLDLNETLLLEKEIEDEGLKNLKGKKVVEVKGTVGSEEEEAKGKTSRNSDDNNATDNEELDLDESLLVEKGIEDGLKNVEGKKVVEVKGTVGSGEKEAKGKTSRNSDDNNASDNEDLDLNETLLLEKGSEDGLENVEGKKVVEMKGMVDSREKEAEGKTSRKVYVSDEGNNNEDKCDEPMDVVESEDQSGEHKNSHKDFNVNLSSLKTSEEVNFSFDIFEEDEESRTSIPIPPSDSEEEIGGSWMGISTEKDTGKDGVVKHTKGKESADSESNEEKTETVKDYNKGHENELGKTENYIPEDDASTKVNLKNSDSQVEPSKIANSESDEKGSKIDRGKDANIKNEFQTDDEMESGRENERELEDKIETSNEKNDGDNVSQSVGISRSIVKKHKVVVNIKKKLFNEENDKTNMDKCSEKIKPSKDDRDAKMAFLLDTSLSSEEGEGEIVQRKKKLRKKKSKHSMDSSDSGSDSARNQKMGIKEERGSESLDEEFPTSALISQFEDEKLKAGCFVPLKKLEKDDGESIPVTSEQKKNRSIDGRDSIEKEIDRLGNLKYLDKTKSKCVSGNDDSDNQKEKPKDKKKSLKKSEKEKKSTEDAQNNSSDEAPQLSSDEIESMNKPGKFTNKVDDGMDAMAEKMLFDSSPSDFEFSDNENEEHLKKKKRVDKSSKEDVEYEKETKKKDDDESSLDDFDVDHSKKSWRKDKLLCGKLSETDSNEEEKRWKAKKEKQQGSQSDSEEDPDSKIAKARKKCKRRLVSSDSEEIFKISSENESNDSSSSDEKSKKRKRAVKSDSSEDKSSGSKTKKKQKRRRIKTLDTDSDASGEDDDDNSNKGDTPNKGRKNIRKVLKGERLGEETKAAAKIEEERKKRIADRQKLYNDIFTDNRNLETLEKLVLDFDPETKKELVYVDPILVKKLKPHQAEGVKFMWDACFESLKRMETEKGSGCILAHCMGLGKTLQVIALVHTLLANPKTKVHTVMVICPLNTVLNWVHEFKIWLKDMGRDNDVQVYELSKYKANIERMYHLKDWQSDGGVMVIGYDMYRNLANSTSKKLRKKVQEVFQSTLVDPGPDLVICDEGHLLKNISSALSKAVNAIKSARRIVLTGTPLQNNLKEYHCMIQFVKPSLLGTHKEFLNRFVNPISNGQCADSTPHDVRVMKRRAHVLHKMLEGCVQRRDYSVLTPFLPPKHEFVICIRLTELQSKLYIHYLENFAQKSGKGGTSLFNDFQNLHRIWTHPRVIKMSSDKEEKKRILQSDSEGSLKDFIDDESDTSTPSSSESGGTRSRKRKKIKRSCKKDNSSSSESSDIICLSDENIEKCSKDKDPNEDEVKQPEQKEWWETYIEQEDHDKIMHSGKLVLLLDILQKCELIGDKVLLFSQSLYSLDLIEYFLEQIDEKTQQLGTQKSTEDTENAEQGFNFIGSWTKGLDYFRIDGSVSGENRSIWCKSFNREDNIRARLFLISTRAGGMGINLVGANRVILFDASWNPSSDLQSIFRIYRFGQKKPCYVYRFLAQGTMEEKIYNRQVTKLSLASRVLDEHQIERHFNFEDLQELYRYEPTVKTKRPIPMLPKDRLLAELIQKYSDLIDNFHEHDSLLENKAEEELTEEERKAAWEEFENEKKEKLPENNVFMGDVSGGLFGGIPSQMYGDQMFSENFLGLREAILEKHPNATEEQLSYELRLATSRISQYFSQANQQQMFNLMAPQSQNRGKMGIYPGMRQLIPDQTALMQAHYGLQNYYHNPLLPSSSTNNNPLMIPTQVPNNASHFVPGLVNNVQQQMQSQLQPPNAHSNVQSRSGLSTVQSGSQVDNVQPLKLKIRSDLMPVSNNSLDDSDIIIEAVKRRE